MLDSTICEVYGRGKQGAAFGYTKVRGYRPQLGTLAETRADDLLAAAGRGGRRGQLPDRNDRLRMGVKFSITARQDAKIRATIEAIPEAVWVPIPYWLSTSEISGADVAEVPYTAFAGTRDAIDVRLVVRRVRPTRARSLAPFTIWSYHAMVTDRASELVEVGCVNPN
ncbi:MAG: hypothetical protein GEV09_00140 [Pseudonocardiaceae bacterium]|nr:hypothetical protein [Pseudonocardiaceae bacterium]